jgi:protein-S-isoprenylcysteine O-methyltransferase Ste14
MSTPNAPDRGQPTPARYPRWMAPILLALAFVLAHIVAPWALSLLTTRYGWVDGRPGPWNLLALVVVIPGLAFTAWMVTVHFRASPDTFLDFRQGRTLLTPGPYAVSRNPMYVVELAFWLGWALFYGSLAVLVGFLLWFALFNFVLVPYEERELEARFGSAYRDYKRQVPRWLGRRRA